MAYTPPADTNAITAHDFRTHVEANHRGNLALDRELMDASAAYIRRDRPRMPTVEDRASSYRERNMAAGISTIGARTGLGYPPLSSEEIEHALRVLGVGQPR